MVEVVVVVVLPFSRVKIHSLSIYKTGREVPVSPQTDVVQQLDL